jgi:hypothetical protein
MAWPQSQDYNEAIQNSQLCFKDPELRQGQPATNPLGMPLPCSGNFADVFQVRCAGEYHGDEETQASEESSLRLEEHTLR